jgi:four helix bundle protein
VPSNIAEGDELGTTKQEIRHFYIAKGSTAEVLTQAVISLEIEYIQKKEYEHIVEGCKEISSMLTMLIKARSEKKPSILEP